MAMKKQQQETKTDRSVDVSQESGFMSNFRLVDQILTKIKFWRQVSAQRTRLSELDDHILKDIGLSRIDAEREASRYFWDTVSNRDVTLRKRGEVEKHENQLARLECYNCQC